LPLLVAAVRTSGLSPIRSLIAFTWLAPVSLLFCLTPWAVAAHLVPLTWTLRSLTLDRIPQRLSASARVPVAAIALPSVAGVRSIVVVTVAFVASVMMSAFITITMLLVSLVSVTVFVVLIDIMLVCVVFVVSMLFLLMALSVFFPFALCALIFVVLAFTGLATSMQFVQAALDGSTELMLTHGVQQFCGFSKMGEQPIVVVIVRFFGMPLRFLVFASTSGFHFSSLDLLYLPLSHLFCSVPSHFSLTARGLSELSLPSCIEFSFAKFVEVLLQLRFLLLQFLFLLAQFLFKHFANLIDSLPSVVFFLSTDCASARKYKRN